MYCTLKSNSNEILNVMNSTKGNKDKKGLP
jgi:hypothetical protein